MSESINVSDAVEGALDEQEEVKQHLRAAADWFHMHEGDLFRRSEVESDVAEVIGTDEYIAGTVVSSLVGDHVDPVVQVEYNNELWVGVIEYHEHDFWYSYEDFHDALGKQPKGVCAQCVKEKDKHTDVAYAQPGVGTLTTGADLSDVRAVLERHFEEEHPDVTVDTIETGATLVAPTTVGGNEDIHKGNMSTEADADTLDSLHAADLAPTYNDGSVTCHIIGKERFGAEGSSTTATSYTTIAGSDLAFDPDDYRDTAGTVYIRLKAHLQHDGAGTTYMHLYRQNAGTTVSGTEVTVSGGGWGIADSGWVSISDSGNESYQLQMKTSDGATGSYNSVLLYFGIPT